VRLDWAELHPLGFFLKAQAYSVNVAHTVIAFLATFYRSYMCKKVVSNTWLAVGILWFQKGYDVDVLDFQIKLLLICFGIF
jgi:hypothetical protein